MSKYADSLTLRVPPADALVLCRQAVEALGWVCQTVQPGDFRCKPSRINAVTLDVSATGVQGSALVLINAEKRFALGPFNERYLRNRIEELKQKVGELAGAGSSPGGSVPTGASTAPGSALSPENRAAFTASQIGREKPPESGTLPMRERQREGSGGLTGGGYGPKEDMVKQATTALMKALSRAVGQDPPPPMPRRTRLNYLLEFERDADAGKITLTPQVRSELTAVRAELERDLINHPDD